LLEHCDVGLVGDGSRYPHAPIVHCLDAEGARWMQTTDDAPLTVDRGLDRVKPVALNQMTTTAHADIVGNDD
jgi:hypothetical protein